MIGSLMFEPYSDEAVSQRSRRVFDHNCSPDSGGSYKENNMLFARQWWNLQQQQNKIMESSVDILNTLDCFVVSSLLYDTAPAFDTLVIYSCNASRPHPFSRAYIDYDTCRLSRYKCASWFGNGFLSIASALGGCNDFKGEKTFENLINTVFKATKHSECLKTMKACETKTEATVRNTLALHYFRPLVYGSNCFVDGGSTDVCEICGQKLKVDDTSLGNQKVWHGKADIVLNHCTMKVDMETDDREDDYDTREPTAKCPKVEGISENEQVNQKNYDNAIAMGIVNAFCEARKDEFFSNKFVPSFVVTDRNIQIVMYNCDLDILLLSEKLEIWDSEELNINTLLLVWLALNFDSYEVKVAEQFLERTPHSDFRKCVGEEVYSLYANEMSKPLKKTVEAKKVIIRANEQGTPMLIAETVYNKLYDEFKRCMEQVNKTSIS